MTVRGKNTSSKIWMPFRKGASEQVCYRLCPYGILQAGVNLLCLHSELAEHEEVSDKWGHSLWLCMLLTLLQALHLRHRETFMSACAADIHTRASTFNTDTTLQRMGLCLRRAKNYSLPEETKKEFIFDPIAWSPLILICWNGQWLHTAQLSDQAKAFSEIQRRKSQLLSLYAGTSTKTAWFSSPPALPRTIRDEQHLRKLPFRCMAMDLGQPSTGTTIGKCLWHASVSSIRCQPAGAMWRNWNSSLVAPCLATRFWLVFCLFLPPPPPSPPLSISVLFHCSHPAVVFDLLSSFLVSSLRTCSCRGEKTEWNIRLHVTMIKRHVRKPRLSF